MATSNVNTPLQVIAKPYHIFPNPFEYNHVEIRAALHPSGDIWFCAQDVCMAVEIKWQGAGKSLRSIPAEWISIANISNALGKQDMHIICEPALYWLLSRSHKPMAVDFTHWVCGEVIPTIRKQGSFDPVSQQDQLTITESVIKLVKELRDTNDAFIFDLLKRRLKNLCNSLGEPIPNLALLGQDRDQLGLGV